MVVLLPALALSVEMVMLVEVELTAVVVALVDEYGVCPQMDPRIMAARLRERAQIRMADSLSGCFPQAVSLGIQTPLL